MPVWHKLACGSFAGLNAALLHGRQIALRLGMMVFKKMFTGFIFSRSSVDSVTINILVFPSIQL